MTEIREWADQVAIAAAATVAVLLLASFFIREIFSQRARPRLPPGPRGWPILGSLPLLGTLPNQSLFNLAKQYGPLMFMHLGSVKTLVVTSAPLAEEIFKTHDQIMASRPEIITAKHMSYNFVDIAYRQYGPAWRYLRKVCTVGLLTQHRLHQFQKIREREVLAALHYILEESERGNAVDMTHCFSTVATNNITEMLMNKSYSVLNGSGSRSAQISPMSVSFSETFRETFKLIGKFNIADFVPLLKPFDPQGALKHVKVLRGRLDKFLDEILEEHRQRPSSVATGQDYNEDFVDALLGFGQTKEFPEALSVNVIKALILDMLAAGGDTSSGTALWALTELIRHPVVMRKVHQELESVVGQKRLVREDDLPELKYLNAVVKETLRLHSPAPLLIPHKSSEACEIGGFHIPAETLVFVNVWGIHRDPALWEKPLDFNPDRFLNSTVDLQGQDFAFLPFGSGRRMCPGMNLGLLMVLYPLSVVLQAIDWTLPEGQKPEELDMSETFGLVLYKRLPLTVLGKARLPNHVIYGARKGQN